MKRRIISLFALGIALSMPRTSEALNTNPVKTIALYWTLGHLVNYVGHYMGQFVATEYLNLKGDAVVTPRLSVKYIINTAGRELLGRNLNSDSNGPIKTYLDGNDGFHLSGQTLYTPELLLIDIPSDLRKSTLPLNARALEAGRNYYTMHELIFKNGAETLNAWNKLHQQPDFQTIPTSANQTESSTLDMMTFMRNSPLIQTAMRDGQLVGLALLHFVIANRIAALSFRVSLATTGYLAQKISWTKHFDDTPVNRAADISVFRLDPFERLISSAVCTAMSQTGKYYLFKLVNDGLDYLKLHDPRYDEFLLAAWKLGDKGLWAYYGLRAQFEALGASYKDSATQQFISVIQSVLGNKQKTA